MVPCGDIDDESAMDSVSAGQKEAQIISSLNLRWQGLLWVCARCVLEMTSECLAYIEYSHAYCEGNTDATPDQVIPDQRYNHLYHKALGEYLHDMRTHHFFANDLVEVETLDWLMGRAMLISVSVEPEEASPTTPKASYVLIRRAVSSRAVS